MNNVYYVYLYRDPLSNQIVYVGKGRDKRAYTHWNRKHSHYNTRFRNYLCDLDEASLEPIIEIYRSGLSNSDAYLLEYNLIKKYGRVEIDEDGILLNLSRGLEWCNIPNDMSIEEYLDKRVHFNYVHISDEEQTEIVGLYESGKYGQVRLAKLFSHGPNKIKKILLEHKCTIKKRGGQFGTLNGMHGKKRPNNAHFSGKTHTKESKNKISSSLKKLPQRHITINDHEYDSLNEAAKMLKIPYSSLSRYVKNNDKSFIRNDIKYTFSITNT